MENIERIWPSLGRFTIVIPVGGGVVVLCEMLRSALAAKRMAGYWPENPVTSNVAGFHK